MCALQAWARTSEPRRREKGAMTPVKNQGSFVSAPPVACMLPVYRSVCLSGWLSVAAAAAAAVAVCLSVCPRLSLSVPVSLCAGLSLCLSLCLGLFALRQG